MNPGDKIIAANKQYTVKKKLGAGGQGSVYLVKDGNGETFALKLIVDKDHRRRDNKINNISQLVNKKADKKFDDAVKNRKIGYIHHVCPMATYMDVKDFGYLMECAKGETVNSMLIDHEIEKMSLQEKGEMLKAIAESIDILHSSGYCYTDINWGNFMWDKASKNVYVIDCENMASTYDINSGKCNFLKGTGFFIAPEVAFNNKNVSYYTDRYALATFIFRIFLNNYLSSAYDGIAMNSAPYACANMYDVAENENEGDLDKSWRKFVFDPKDHSNAVDDLCKNSKHPDNVARRKKIEAAIKIWKTLDDRLKNLFYKAFSDPFDEKSRPTASAWANTLGEIFGGKPAKPSVKRSRPAKPANTQVGTKNQKGAVTAQTPKKSEGAADQASADLSSKYPAFNPACGGSTAQSDWAGKYPAFTPANKETK